MLNRLFGRRREENRGPSAGELSSEELKARVASVEEWYHRIEVAPGIVTPGLHDSQSALNTLQLPEDMGGMRVLDVGARDGFFSFEAEKRGAEVLAIDAVALEHLHGFRVARELLGSSVEFRTANVYNLRPEGVGLFDAIFFLGVLYHLRDPMLALDRLWSVAKPGAKVWVESHTIDKGLADPETGVWRNLEKLAPQLSNIPLAQFYPGDTLGGNPSNWWGPNLAALKAMIQSAGFKIESAETIGSRGLVVARKVEDPKTEFWQEFDRAEGTGEEGMAWHNKQSWSEPQKES